MIHLIKHIKFNHPSSSWNTGLFAMIDERATEYKTIKLTDEGKLQKFESGKYMTTIISRRSDCIITPTSLFISLP